MGQKSSKSFWTYMYTSSTYTPRDLLCDKSLVCTRPKMSDVWESLFRNETLTFLLRCVANFQDVPEKWVQLFEVAYNNKEAVLIDSVYDGEGLSSPRYKMSFTQTLPLKEGIKKRTVGLYILLSEQKWKEFSKDVENVRKIREQKELEAKARFVLNAETKLSTYSK